MYIYIYIYMYTCTAPALRRADYLISQKCPQGGFARVPHKSVNLSFIITQKKNKSTDSCGN